MTARPRLRITGRSSSHFTRVVRMVAHELALPTEYTVLADIMSTDTAHYSGHPALKIPTLHVDDRPLWGTDSITRRLVALAGRERDPRVVLPHHLHDDLCLNAQELVWHAMSAQVTLVLGLRVSKLPADNVFFAKARLGLEGALAWLDPHLDAVLDALPAPRDWSLFEITTFCLVEHLVFRPSVSLEGAPRLRAFAKEYGLRASAQHTPFFFDPA